MSRMRRERLEAVRPYPEVPPQPDLPALEQRVLDRWIAERIFERSVESRPSGQGGSNEYVFYDGPPFANGLPHYGHLVTGYIKDIVPRYQTLRGRRVERRFGWDCHGLPAEMEAERELGVSGRNEITEYGIGRFNEHCRRSVLKYTREWQRTVHRAARWVDFENDYKTLDLPYMESVLWALKRLWDRGLLYEGYRVMPYSWAAQTPLSNFETRLDDSYRERQDPAITVAFELEPAPGDDGPIALLAWTTTPWTLPSNLALAVGPEIEYTVFELEGRRLVLGSATAAKYERELEGARRVGTRLGIGAGRSPLPAALPVLRRHRERLPGARRRLRRHRGGNGRRPHGPRVRRGRHGRLHGGRHPGRRARRRLRVLHRRGAAVAGPPGLRREPATSCATCASGACSSAATPTSTTTPTAGARTSR